MDSQAFFLILIFCSPLFIFLIHIAVARCALKFRLPVQPLFTGVISIMITFAWMACYVAATFLRGLSDTDSVIMAVIYGTVAFSGLAFCYFQVFAMTETARRLHILHELLATGKMSVSELEARYGADRMLAVRLERMVEIGQLQERNGRFTVRGSLLLWVGRIMALWARVLGF